MSLSGNLVVSSFFVDLDGNEDTENAGVLVDLDKDAHTQDIGVDGS